MAVLTWHRRQLPSNVRKESFDIATPAEVERLLRPPLLRKAHPGLSRKPLRERALDHDALISRLVGKILSGVAGCVHVRAGEVRVLIGVLHATC